MPPDEALSQAERMATNPALGAWLASLSLDALERVQKLWSFWERPGQRMPEGDWRIWLVMAGRGFGKTRMGAEWVRAAAENGQRRRIALVGATDAEVRRVMIEGESGLLAVASPRMMPRWEPSIGRLTWPTGTQAEIFSAAEPERLRGPQHDIAWADEIAKWPHAEAAWDNLMLTLRAGRPRVMATTTPRSVPLIRRLSGNPAVAKTQGGTLNNRAHLAKSFVAAMLADYGGTRLGRQELDGELIEDVEGALWRRATIEACRVRAAPALVRVVVGVDPPAGIGGDSCGIVAVGLGRDGRGYVIEDASVQGLAPDGWSRAVAACAARHQADRVVAEKNQGGEMVASVLRAADAGLPLALVHASKGKAARAEPVHLLYESGRMRHAGAFADLEDQLCGLIAGGGYEGPGRSPDRADALVWAAHELLLGRRGRASVRAL